MGIRKQIELYEAAHRHDARPDPRNPGALIAENPGQQLRFEFGVAGVRVRAWDGAAAGPRAELVLSLTSAGLPERLAPVEGAAPEATGNRVEYRRGLLTEWYVNDARGLEQGFTFAAPLGDATPAGAAHELAVAVELPEGWSAQTDADGRGLTLRQAHGPARIAYRGLRAFDAAGRDLPARLEAGAGRILLVADARDAVYPVTIDPVLTNLEAQIFSLGPDTGGGFGNSLAIDSDTLVVGGTYVFERAPGEDWTVVAKLVASDPNPSPTDRFGQSVAISGDTIVVGASRNAAGITNSGSAYVFVKPAAGWSGTLTETAKLRASDAAADDEFAKVVAISDDTIAVGAELEDTAFTSSGSVYVFDMPVSGWSGLLTENARLRPSVPAANDFFGQSLSMADGTIVAGARNPSSSFSGAAYVFVEPSGGWTGVVNESAKLTASDAAPGDALAGGGGSSISIFGDWIAVGAYLDDDVGDGSGSVYVFTKPAGGWSGSIHESAKLRSSDGAAGDALGPSVSAADGIVVAGASRDDDVASSSGSAYVFIEPAGGWTGQIFETAKLTASDAAASDLFGETVAASGGTLVVATNDTEGIGGIRGSAYVFEEPSGGWSGLLQESVELTSAGWTIPETVQHGVRLFGTATALSGDLLVVGIFANIGAAYVFELAEGAWEFRAKLLASDAAPTELFGTAVAIDGDTVVVGASGDFDSVGGESGSAYVYVEPEDGWFGAMYQNAKLRPSNAATVEDFGISVAVDGDVVVVGAPSTRGTDTSQQGKAYVYQRPLAGWSGLQTENARLTTALPYGASHLGTAVDIEGDVVVAGAPSALVDLAPGGAAYVFAKPVSGWSGTVGEIARLVAVNTSGLGSSVAISGGAVAVGAPFEGVGYKGAVYVYEPPAGGWSGTLTQTGRLVAAGTTGELGTSVAFSGSDVAAGARYDSAAALQSGAAFWFRKPAVGWSGTQAETLKLLAPDARASDQYGRAVALSGARLAVGAPYHDGTDLNLHHDIGAVYVYTHAFRNCGNGALDAGESCDDGNNLSGDCCSDTCTIEPVLVQCRAAAGACDVAEHCDGANPSCPADAFATETTVCRAAAGVCDAAEMCSGATATCPADAKLTGLCRDAAGVCDVAELCDGASDGCPQDALVAAGSICRAGAGSCDVPESCDGGSDTCPADAVLPDGSVCGEDDACHSGELCAGGLCTGGTEIDCDDENPCTADSCDAVLGCGHEPILECAPQVPATPAWGPALVALLLIGICTPTLRRRARTPTAG